MNKKGIAIDGPAGAGKSTIVKLVAEKLGINYVDSGSLYRTIAYCLKQNDIDINDALEMTNEELLEILNAMEIVPQFEDGKQINYLNDEKVEDNLLRTEDMSINASTISTNGLVRDKVTNICRDIAKRYNVIMEGRDTTTVIMTDALLKVYLDADVLERANRRIGQLKEKGLKAPSLDEMIEDIKKRDNQDMNRDIAPLKIAEDAIVLVSSNLTIEEVVNIIIDEYNERTK